MKWKPKDEIDAEKTKAKAKKAEKEKLKGKSFTTLSNKEKDELLERMARDLGYIE